MNGRLSLPLPAAWQTVTSSYSWRRTDGPEMISSTGVDSDSDFGGWMLADGVSKDCIFEEDFRYIFKPAIGAVVCEIR